MNATDSFKKLFDIVATLLGPQGCIWAAKQNIRSLRQHLLEETSEVLDAIDMHDPQLLQEEVGDLLFNILFLSFVANKEGLFSFEDMVEQLCQKLIRRHPHVFADVKIETLEQLRVQWEAIKQTEAGKEKRQSVLDSIPKALPALAKTQKIQEKMREAGYDTLPISCKTPEVAAGEEIWALIRRLGERGVDAERALLSYLRLCEEAYRQREKGTTGDYL